MPTLDFNLAGLGELLKKIKRPEMEGALPEARTISPILSSPGAPGATAPAPASIPSEVHDPFKGGPLGSLKEEARLREKFKGIDFSDRTYSDPVTQAKYENVYGSGKSVQDIEHPGFWGRMKQGGKAGLLGLATGKGTGFLGGVIDPAASREEVFDITEGDRMRAQQAQEMEQKSGLLKLQEILARIRHQDVLDRGTISEIDHRKRSADLADRKQEMAETDPYEVGGVLVDRKTRQPIFDSRREPRSTPHWVRDESGNYVDLNDPANKGKSIRGYEKPEGELSISDVAKLSELEAAANFDAGSAIQKFREGVRPQVYAQFGITPEMEKIAKDTKGDQYGQYSDEKKEIMRRVQMAEEELNKQAQLFAKKREQSLAAEAARKRLEQTKKYGSGGKKSGTNLTSDYKGDAFYGFK